MSTTCSLACTAVAMVTVGQVRESLSSSCLGVQLSPSVVFLSPAHSGPVRGVAVDGLNQLTFTSGSDWLLKFWCFKSKKQEEQLQLKAAAAQMKLHRER